MILPEECICIECKHLDTDGTEVFCKAFPDGIPDDILDGNNDHKKIHKDQDNKILFTERDG